MRLAYRSRIPRAKYALANKLRNNPTASERILWDHLRDYRIDGYKFRRQAVILGWIADFLCPEFRLVVELDGKFHVGREAQDAVRDSVMKNHGFTILRLQSRRVFTYLPGLLNDIREAVHTLAISARGNALESEARGRRTGRRKVLPVKAARKLRAA